MLACLPPSSGYTGKASRRRREESGMRRIFVAAFAGLVSIGTGVAADDPIHAREALMEANGKISKPIVAIMKGAPFQLEAVQAALKQYIKTSEKAATLFPPGSDKGKTEALPVIWK